MGTEMTKWGGYSEDAVKEEARELSSGSYFKFVPGINTIRVIPGKAGTKSPFVVVHEHFIDTAAGQKASFACPRVHAKQTCPVCEKAKRLMEAGNQRDYTVGKRLLPGRRVYANVLDRADPEGGIKIAGFGKTIHEGLAELREDHGDFTNPLEEGYDVLVKRKGTGPTDTEYKVKKGDNCALADSMEEIEALVESQPDLSLKTTILSASQISELLGEEGIDEEDDFDTKPPAPPSKPALPAKTAAKTTIPTKPAGKGKPAPARSIADSADDDGFGEGF
jgi:hypothetical protein